MDGMNTDDEEDDENEQRQKQVSSGAARGGVLAPAGNQLAPQSPHQATPPSPAHSTSSTGSAVGLLRMSSLSGSCLVSHSLKYILTLRPGHDNIFVSE